MDVTPRQWWHSARQGVYVFGLLFSVLTAGCGEPYKPSLSEDEARKAAARLKPVPPPMLAVSGETITFDSVYNAPLASRKVRLGPYLTRMARTSDLQTFREEAFKEVRASLGILIDDTLLYQQARREGGDRIQEGLDKVADREWREFVVQNGGDEAAAERVLQEAGSSRTEFRELRKRAILTQYLLSLRQPADEPISHKEMVEAYNRMKDTDFAIKPRLTFRSIDIQPSRLQLADLSMDRYTQALALATDLMAKLGAGEDFAALARQYSGDPMAPSGGLWDSVDPNSLAEPYDSLAVRAMALPIGRVEGPVEIRGHVFILRVEARQEPGHRPLADVQDRVAEQIRRVRREQAQSRLDAELAERAKVGQTEEFVSRCVDEIYRRSQATP